MELCASQAARILNCSTQFVKKHFQPTSYTDGGHKRYDLDVIIAARDKLRKEGLTHVIAPFTRKQQKDALAIVSKPKK